MTEEFTPSEQDILRRYFTNRDRPVNFFATLRAPSFASVPDIVKYTTCKVSGKCEVSNSANRT